MVCVHAPSALFLGYVEPCTLFNSGAPPPRTESCTTNAVRTVLYAKNDGSGVSESRDVNGLTVAPNPVKNVVNVVSGEALKSVVVVDMDGRAVLSVNAAGKNVLNLNAAALSNGMYIIKVIAESGNMFAVKIIKE